MSYNVYILDGKYVGITTKDVVEVRGEEHVLQSVKNFGTRKDKYIFSRLLAGHLPRLVKLFTSEWSEADVAAAKLKYPKKEDDSEASYNRSIQKYLAGRDEVAVSVYLRDIIKVKDLMNVAAGTSLGNLSRTLTLDKVSENCRRWLDEDHARRHKVTTDTPAWAYGCMGYEPLVLLPRSQVKTFAKNTVTWDDQETVMVVTPSKVWYEDHKFCGPNTRHINYYWRNTYDASARNYVHWERYIDTYDAAPLEEGKDYIVYTEKRGAPEDPTNTKCWFWGNYSPFTARTAMDLLQQRLDRIDILQHKFPAFGEWEPLVDLRKTTKFIQRDILADCGPTLDEKVTVTNLVNLFQAG